MKNSLAEPTEIIILGTAFIICVNVDPILTEEKKKGTVTREMVMS